MADFVMNGTAEIGRHFSARQETAEKVFYDGKRNILMSELHRGMREPECYSSKPQSPMCGRV